MIDTLLALVPDYGLIVVVVLVFLGCLGVPLPTLLIALAAGGFSATGDLSIATVVPSILAAIFSGDLVAFVIGRRMGEPLVERLASGRRTAPATARGRSLLERFGTLAIFLSRTVFSPTGPYVTYLAAAGGLPWRRFILAAVPGAIAWTLFYTSLGHLFASRIEELAALFGNVIGTTVASLIVAVLIALLIRRWHGWTHSPRRRTSAKDEPT